MHHLAILSKRLKLLDKIIKGEKTIESRWYKSKKTPYGNIKKGDTIYFKNSGDPVTVKAEVEKSLFFDLRFTDVKEILKDYSKQICIQETAIEKYKDKNYCTLVFLKAVEKIEPFNINKSGYCLMSAWITLENINQLKI